MEVQELMKLVGPVLVAIGIFRGRLNGLVKQVDRLEARLTRQEDRYAECKARLEAADDA